MTQDPLKQTYLVVRASNQYFLLPMISNHLITKEDQISTNKQLDAEEADVQIQIEPSDEYIVPDTPNLENNIADVFMCHVCSKVFYTGLSLQLHIDKHSVVKSDVHSDDHGNLHNYECSVCGRLFAIKKALKLHMEKHQNVKNMYYCTDCGFRSTAQFNVTRHRLRKHANIFRFPCPYCSKKYNLRNDLNKHMLKHANVIEKKDVTQSKALFIKDNTNDSDQSAYPNDDISEKKMEEPKPNYKDVIQSEVLIEEDTKDCDQNTCPNDITHETIEESKLPKLKNWKREIFIRSEEERKNIYAYKCLQCKWSNQEDKVTMKEQINREVTMDVPILKVYSGKATPLKKLTRKKEGLKMKKEAVSCEVCKESFNMTGSEYRKHLLSHGKFRTFPCDVCSKKFKHKHNMQRHKSKVHGEAPIYTCQYCDFTTLHCSYLQVHVTRKHTNDFHYLCDKCDRKFRIKADYTKHLITHEKETCICNICVPHMQEEASVSKELGQSSAATRATVHLRGMWDGVNTKKCFKETHQDSLWRETIRLSHL
ncbi:hypothetical protein KPH14_008912 [Odynerus spinipes]|uniref:C2H2-type domain-containing protein n=1 Tax=Odynerus spinipes TaxID=1348599 RepID=A0AAD9VQ01_9HYME|nr:hypothetical protein KPH14_008912 [Odynerus spinipes]